MSERVGPPWVVVILLPDDLTPAEAAANGLGMPPGARGVALCAEPAEAVIATLPEEYRR